MKKVILEAIISAFSLTAFVLGLLRSLQALSTLKIPTYPITYFIILFLVLLISWLVYYFKKLHTVNLPLRSIKLPSTNNENSNTNTIEIVNMWNSLLLRLIDQMIKTKTWIDSGNTPAKVIEIRNQNSELVFVVQQGSLNGMQSDLECSFYIEEERLCHEMASLTIFNVQDSISSARVAEIKDEQSINAIKQQIISSGIPFMNSGMFIKPILSRDINDYTTTELERIKKLMLYFYLRYNKLVN